MSGWIETASGISMPSEAVTDGPHVQWNHIDGPFLTWAGHCHWLTYRERLSIWLGFSSVDEVARKRWPHLDRLRFKLTVEPRP